MGHQIMTERAATLAVAHGQQHPQHDAGRLERLLTVKAESVLPPARAEDLSTCRTARCAPAGAALAARTTAARTEVAA